MSTLLFIPLGAEGIDPFVLGAMEVPSCFRPSDAFIDRAQASGVALVLATGPTVLTNDLVEMGRRYFERLVAA